MRNRKRKDTADRLEKQAQRHYRESELTPERLKTLEMRGPLAVELGCGRGRFLTHFARQHPECQCLGIELKEEVLVRACERASAENVENVHFILGDVARILSLFEETQVQYLFIHFCDPWPKLRHAKRRLMHQHFLQLYHGVLAKGGVLQFKTDNKDLFEFALNELIVTPFALNSIALDVHRHPAWLHNIQTEYEEKFTALGQPIYGVKAIRKG